MKWIGGCLAIVLLALPAANGEEPKKEPTVKEKYSELLKDFGAKQKEIADSYQKAKEEERPAILKKYRSLGKDWADKFYKLAEDNLADPVAADALSWVVQNATGSEFVQKAMDRLLDKFPDHSSIERICATLGRNDSKDAEKALRKIVEKASKPNIKAAATLALAKNLAMQTDALGDKPAEGDKVAAEAEKQFAAAIELYKDNAAQKSAAEKELKAIKTLRVGKEAPEIKAPDLDGKDFKLSDYRGKVVLLDFWGNW
jgi:hypothetical protein